MTGIIITGHGHFPTGLLSAVSLVAGRPEQTEAVDFEEGMSSEDLKAGIAAAAEALGGDELLILADLTGGTPFNVSAGFRAEHPEKKLRVIAGANMPAVVEAVFSRALYDLDQLADAVLVAGSQGVRDLEKLEDEAEEPEFEDGL